MFKTTDTNTLKQDKKVSVMLVHLFVNHVWNTTINQQRLLLVLMGLILEHRNPNPSSSKSKTTHSNGGKSIDGELLTQNLVHRILCHSVLELL